MLLNIQIILDYIYIEFKSKFSKKIQNTPILNNYYDCVAYTIYETIALVGGSKNTLLLTYACVKMAKLSLKYAPSTETSMGFMALGYIHTRTGNFKKAYQYGQQSSSLILIQNQKILATYILHIQVFYHEYPSQRLYSTI